MTCPKAIDVVVRVGPAVVDVVTPGPPGPPGEDGTGGSASLVFRYAISGLYSYVGRASAGSPTSANHFVTRILESTSASITSVATATGPWTNYSNLTYT